MVQRHFWLKKIEDLWEKRSILWLSGVRRVGKTYLCQSLKDIEYFDCELPSTRRIMTDPEAFLSSLNKKRIVLDEIHRLPNPSELLKIAADHYKNIKIIATGSSTLGASAKFKDTLSGRKTNLWLTPMIINDIKDFGNINLTHRLKNGGLPPFFLEKEIREYNFQEWVDAYWARDIQELFRLEKRYSFQKFLEMLFVQSGGIFEATRFSAPCEASRSTITNYLKVLESTFVAHLIRPFSHRKPTEIISAPKVYVFDTGFVSYYKDWDKLRQEDLGILWEHFVLNEFQAQLQSHQIYFWRDKRGHEIDFILLQRGNIPIAIECKWSLQGFNPINLLAFRRQYPKGKNFVVSSDVSHSFNQNYEKILVKFIDLPTLVNSVLQDLK